MGYKKAFEEAGYFKIGNDVEVAAMRIRESNIRQALVATIDSWALEATYSKDAKYEAVAAIANPVANFVPTGLGPDGSGMRVAVAATGVGDHVNVVVGAGRNMPGVVKVYPGSGFTRSTMTRSPFGDWKRNTGVCVCHHGVFAGLLGFKHELPKMSIVRVE